LKYYKLTLKTANIPKSQNEKILKFISETFNKADSNNIMISKKFNNPIKLNREDLIITIRKILEK
jgi:hypothetical protein